MIHEDERRTLEDWPEAKIITAKQDCVLGGHWHKVKTERFILVEGEGTVSHGKELWSRGGQIHCSIDKLKVGNLVTIEPNTYHCFNLKKGSVLIGLCSHPYDPSDDYR